MLKWNQVILLVVCWWVTLSLKPAIAEPNRHEGQPFEDTDNREANRASALNNLRGLGINLPATARMVKELAEKNPSSIQEADFRAALEKVPGLTPQQKDGLLKQFLNLGGQEFFVVTSNYLNELSASAGEASPKGKESGEDEDKKKQADEDKKKAEEAQKKFQEVLLKALQKKEEKKQEGKEDKGREREEGNKGNEKGGGEGRGAGGENQDREKNKDKNKEAHDEKLKKKPIERGARENTDNEKKENKKDEKENKKESNKDSVESLLKELDSQKEKDASKKAASENKAETPSPVRPSEVETPSTVKRIADLGPKSALQPLTGSIGTGSFLNLGGSAGASAGGLGSAPITPGSMPGPLSSGGSDLSSMRFSDDYSGYAAPSAGISQFFKGNFYSEGGATSEASSSSNESPEGEYAMADSDSRSRNSFKGAQIISQPHAERETNREFGIFSVKEELMKKVMINALAGE